MTGCFGCLIHYSRSRIDAPGQPVGMEETVEQESSEPGQLIGDCIKPWFRNPPLWHDSLSCEKLSLQSFFACSMAQNFPTRLALDTSLRSGICGRVILDASNGASALTFVLENVPGLKQRPSLLQGLSRYHAPTTTIKRGGPAERAQQPPSPVAYLGEPHVAHLVCNLRWRSFFVSSRFQGVRSS